MGDATNLGSFIILFKSYGYRWLSEGFLCMKEHTCGTSRLSRPHNSFETSELYQKRNDSTWTQRKQKKCIVLTLKESNIKEGKTWKWGSKGVPCHERNLRVMAGPRKACSTILGHSDFLNGTLQFWCPGLLPALLLCSTRSSHPHCPAATLAGCSSNHPGILSLLDLLS